MILATLAEAAAESNPLTWPEAFLLGVVVIALGAFFIACIR